ncbi:xanthine dehydrogenase subunit D [Alteribacillus sp. HJP-4]|uniref:xanthine dehydrogenase subunit D n=1 Tax=Alteribacillus sp. HJP-4 TaxID=2775394 RepID=UPI0035CCCFEC
MKKTKSTRPDGKPKVTGNLKYLTDIRFPGMLYGKILRSAYPHAEIKSLSVTRAEQLDGVHAVVTHQDVPGVNGYGIIIPDQPVLCDDRVRYVGDAIAAVAAETTAIAEEALMLIEVEYKILPILDDPEKSMQPDALKLHPGGNILHRAGHRSGNPEREFSRCNVIIEETYELPRQMHTYMETEGGVIVPESDGGITVFMGTQHGFKDQFQLSRILAVPEELIRVVSSPMGGSFGGKDELNVQPYAALLAIKSGRPVQIHQTRKESVISGIKRHPMKITMKTGTDAAGKIVAHDVRIVADTGAYSTLGPAILDFAVEHSCGPYRIPNVQVKGLSVFTNNGVAGEFRGFGGNQITFAIEGQIDRIAEKLQIHPVEMRKRNLRHKNDPGPLGQKVAPTNGAVHVLEEIERYQPGDATASSSICKKTGSGIAIAMHGGGLGYGRLDPAGGRLALTENGKIEAAFGFEEAGQGILAVIETIVTSELGCDAEDLMISIGDTDKVPVSGSTTASRGTSMVWHAVERMKHHFLKQLSEKAGQLMKISPHELKLGKGGFYQKSTMVLSLKELAYALQSEELISVTTSFDFPTTPDEVDGGHFLYTFAAVRAEVEVDLLTGMVKVLRLDQAVSAGPVVNDLGYKGQVEGGGIMALGYTLMEDAFMLEGRYTTENLDTYIIPGISDVPFEINVHAIEKLEKGDSYGPRGVGEIGTVAVAPAITKAIHNAAGFWTAKLPIHPEILLSEVMNKGEHPWKKTAGKL